MATLRFLTLLLFLLFGQTMIPAKNTELHLSLSENPSLLEILSMLHKVCNIQKLLIKLLISHQLLECNQIPIFEAALKILVDFNRVYVLNESEVFPWNAVLDAWWGYQALVGLAVG